MKRFIQISGLLILIATMSFRGSEQKTILIDAGHGGKDNGMVANSLNEKELALQMAQTVKELNKNDDLKIVLMRNDDQYVSLEDRVKKINSLHPDAVISLHFNSSENNDKGAEVYVSEKNKKLVQSRKLAKTLMQNKPEAVKKGRLKTGGFFVLRQSKVPAVLLEFGYLTNQKDAEYLSSEKGQVAWARAILNSLD